jgi:hypothetical protein
MLGKSRAIIVGAVALVVAAALAVPAFGEVMCTLTATPNTGTYGTDVVLQPAVTTQTVPGDQFSIQVYDLTSAAWVKYGEGLTVEDTATVDPQSILIDDSVSYPAIFRTVFLPKSSKNTTAAVSDPIVVAMRRNLKTAVVISAPKTMSRNKAYTVGATVKPDSGAGKVAVRIKNPKGRVVKSLTLTTDELGYVETTFKASSAGRYRIEMKWLGNQFGVPSATASAVVTVR